MTAGIKVNVPRILDASSFGALLFLFLSGMFLFIAKDPTVWVNLVFDDAYYYLGIVRGLLDGRGSSFMPPFETNGYQPLWLIILWASAKVFGTSDQSLIIQIFSLSFLSVLLFGIVSKIRYGYFFPAIACAISFSFVTLFGLETTLLPLLFVTFMSTQHWVKKGVLGSVIFLTRLDALSVVIARDAYSLFKKEKVDLRHYLIVLPAITTYFVINYLLFKTPIPVSGLSKSVGDVFGENTAVGLSYLNALKSTIVLFAAVLAFLAINRQGISFKFKKELSILTMALCICAAYYIFKSGWPIWQWYVWPVFLLTYYLCMESVILLKSHSPVVLSARFVTSSLLILAALAYVFTPGIRLVDDRVMSFTDTLKSIPRPESFGKRNLELVDFIKKTMPKGTFFAMGDRAGSFGFFLGNDFKFMHTEGLVGPYEYYQAMKKDQGEAFIDKLPIDYIIADREKYLEDDAVIGIAEPVQGLSSHSGPYLMCFHKSGIVLDQSYGVNRRYLIAYRSKTPCPATLTASFLKLRNQYEGLSKFSLPSKYELRNGLSKVLG
jgi:hypothetical protein